MASKRIIYSRGFPYGAPLCTIRGGATKDEAVRNFIKEHRFTWNPARHGWEHYLNRREFGEILKRLRDEFGCEVIPKQGMDWAYVIDLDDPNFYAPEPDVIHYDGKEHRRVIV